MNFTDTFNQMEAEDKETFYKKKAAPSVAFLN